MNLYQDSPLRKIRAARAVAHVVASFLKSWRNRKHPAKIPSANVCVRKENSSVTCTATHVRTREPALG